MNSSDIVCQTKDPFFDSLPTPATTTEVTASNCTPSFATTNTSGCTADHFRSKVGLNYTVICVGVAIVLENCLLISVVARNARLHTNTNLLVASLAFTDVLMGVQCCIIGMTGFSVGVRSWLATSDLHIFDVFMLSINLSLIGVSLLHVFSLALDRYLYVLWPFRYRRYVTRRTVLAVAVGSWTLGFVYALLPLALFNGHRHRRLCILIDIPVSFSYVPIGCVYVVCLGVVTYCTAGLVRLAHQHRRGRLRKLIGDRDSKMFCSEFNHKAKDATQFSTNDSKAMHTIQSSTNDTKTIGATISPTKKTIVVDVILASTECTEVIDATQSLTNDTKTIDATQSLTNDTKTVNATQSSTNDTKTTYTTQFSTNDTKTIDATQASTNYTKTIGATPFSTKDIKTIDSTQSSTNNTKTIDSTQCSTNETKNIGATQSSTNDTKTKDATISPTKNTKVIDTSSSAKANLSVAATSSSTNDTLCVAATSLPTNDTLCVAVTSSSTNDTLSVAAISSSANDTSSLSATSSSTNKTLSEAATSSSTKNTCGINAISVSTNDKGRHVTQNIGGNISINPRAANLSNTFNTASDVTRELKVNFNVKQEQCARFFNRSNLKIIKFVLVVFVSFLVCTFPPVTLLSLDKIFNLSLFSENDFAIDILRFMVMSNSGINFFSITYMNRDFRRALVKSLPFCKLIFCNR